jgi:hypothetical protein
MQRSGRFSLILALLVLSFAPLRAKAADTWRAGVAKVDITPPQFMPMAGYASRGANHAKGKLTDLWAKALVIDDPAGHRAALVTLDLIGLERGHAQAICEELGKRYKLKREQIALCTSHTHCGPVVAKNLRPLHYLILSEADQKLVDEYGDFVQAKIVAAVGEAIENQMDARLAWGSGAATFATNRRNNPEGEAARLREENKLKGPFDHDVPVLAVHAGDSDAKPLAVVFGYACHNTTLDNYDWSGDYAGFAQIEVEKAHPETVALFWAGCGGDQNPLPRRQVEFAKDYGRQLGEAVSKVLSGEMRPIAGELATTFREIDLPLDKLPTREEIAKSAASTNIYEAARAKHLLAQLEGGKDLAQTYPYAIATWRLGDDVRWVFLGGEVVVDYAIRLKTELSSEKQAGKNLWVAGYTNDVMAYIPSRRVLTEGGYEGGGAMVYYGLPTTWAPEVEKVIVDEVHRQVKP